MHTSDREGPQAEPAQSGGGRGPALAHARRSTLTEPVCSLGRGSSGVGCCLLPSSGTNMKTWVHESGPSQAGTGAHVEALCPACAIRAWRQDLPPQCSEFSVFYGSAWTGLKQSEGGHDISIFFLKTLAVFGYGLESEQSFLLFWLFCSHVSV